MAAYISRNYYRKEVRNVIRARRSGELTPQMQQRRRAFIDWVKRNDYGKTIGGILTAKNDKLLVDLANYVRSHRILTDKQMRAAMNAVGRKLDVDRYSAKSHFVGRKGNKIEFEAVVVGAYPMSGTWGDLEIVKMRDIDGNLYTWKASRITGLVRSDRVLISGTIKGHDSYRGVKQTIITRCKFERFEIADPNNLEGVA